MYGALVRHWWWSGIYSDKLRFARGYPECAVVSGGSRPHQPPLHPIPVQRPFQIVGVDVMELPLTEDGNCSGLLNEVPPGVPMPDQKAIRIVKLLVKEVIPFFGVLKSLLSD